LRAVDGEPISAFPLFPVLEMKSEDNLSNLARPTAVARALWWMMGGIILAIPITVTWNISAPNLAIQFGQPLFGVTDEIERPKSSVRGFTTGALQKWIAERAVAHVPGRAFMIRLHNELMYDLLNASRNSWVFFGEAGFVMDKPSMLAYCDRSLAKLAQNAQAELRDLHAIQDFYTERDKTFVYVITPTKAAYMPEVFLHRFPCKGSSAERDAWIPTWTSILRREGIHFVDTVSLLARIREKYELPLFPKGGVHWNAIGAAHAANALIEGLNAANPELRQPLLSWTYSIVPYAVGYDDDSFQLLNLIRSRLNYPSPIVSFHPSSSCPGPPVKIAIVGGSFVTQISEALVRNGCIDPVWHYFYLYPALVEFPGQKVLQTNLAAADVASLRDANILILEESEDGIGGTWHVAELRRILSDH
jgi:alginate O-acetyltransferase complex protein AlgJ